MCTYYATKVPHLEDPIDVITMMTNFYILNLLPRFLKFREVNLDIKYYMWIFSQVVDKKEKYTIFK